MDRVNQLLSSNAENYSPQDKAASFNALLRDAPYPNDDLSPWMGPIHDMVPGYSPGPGRLSINVQDLRGKSPSYWTMAKGYGNAIWEALNEMSAEEKRQDYAQKRGALGLRRLENRAGRGIDWPSIALPTPPDMLGR
jgi:hypothetical protein